MSKIKVTLNKEFIEDRRYAFDFVGYRCKNYFIAILFAYIGSIKP